MDGPAIEHENGRREWWVNNKQITEEEFELMKKCIYRKIQNRKMIRLIRLSKTREFNEWFYHPNNLGGKWAKKSLFNLFV